MKKLLSLVLLSLWCVARAHASFSVNLDTGQLTGPAGAAMQADNTSGSANGSLLLLIDLGSSTGAIDNNVTAGNFASGTNFTLLAAAGFNSNGGTNEALASFNITSGAGTITAGDQLALRWFPQITLSQFNSGTLTLAGQYYGTYAPPVGTTPDDGNLWVVPSSGTIDLNFFTTNSDGGGSQLPSAGLASSQVLAVPEPSTYVLLGIGSVLLCWIARFRKLGCA